MIKESLYKEERNSYRQVHGDMAFLKQEIQNLIQLDHPHVAASRS